MYDIIIVGAGAAGLSSATWASITQKNISILILEKGNKCGRKLSASGNGKCNITNRIFSEACYHSFNDGFISEFVNTHSNSEIIDFFNKCGIMVYEKDNYFYPTSNQAKQVTSRFLEICKAHKVELEYDQCVTDIKVDNDNCYIVKTTDNEYRTRKVIIASGSSSCPELGGSDTGFELLKKMGIRETDIYPVLSPIYVDDKNISTASGVRLNAVVSLKKDGELIKETGQLQINRDNLSGIAIMNLSCYLPMLGKNSLKDCIYVDCLPEVSWEELKKFINSQVFAHRVNNVLSILEGLFPTQFAKYILDRVHIEYDCGIEKLSEKVINKITSNIKKMTFTPICKYDINKSQASLGGVSTDEIDWSSYESLKYRGFYIVGEALDMTGKCGGYNLMFAFISGINAIKHAIKDI